ncbi:MAG: aspartate aminotransferase family protein [Gammaproteobacteria bacterium]|nr:MAG: aspartate aminotransferase family protein [Gammaproteobacteria bacterium]
MSTEHSLAELQELDRQHYLHPFSDPRQIAERGTRVITRGEGVYIYDTEGRQILDAMSGLWCVSLGYGRRELIEAATRQLETLPYYNSFFQCSHPPAIELAALLADVAPPGFSRVFYTNSGSEANDTVIRMVRRYWDIQGQPERKTLISRRNAYHGSTIGGMSLGGMPAQQAQGDLPIPGIAHIGQPYWFEEGGGLHPDEFGLKVAGELEAKILELGADRVAAFIGEPVQGAGGVIIPPDTYWPEIQRICDQYDILLVADEVITGFGRLGEWFASQHYAIEPDLVIFAKAVNGGYLPLGGVLVGDRVADALVDGGGEFFHGFTHSGNPVACAVAIAALQVMHEEGIVERVRERIAPYFASRWQSLATHPLVGEARSVGLLGAIELVADPATRARFPPALRVGETCRDTSVDLGLVMRHVRDSLIVAPPLVISEAQVDEMVDKARRTLDRVARRLRPGA